MPARAEPIDLIVQAIDRDRVMPERREAVREPPAARAQIQRTNRSLPDPWQRALLKMGVTLAADAPFGRVRIVLRDHWQHPVVLRRRFAKAILLPHGAVLRRKRPC